ncbi:MAG: UDP-N-acetylmuramoyl-tripeptide--D-alanyl-D-alanine ligase [Prevotellaceae bacterium]|nr:UDP-N-acetylmuramoyl-tripeptide--D-alanyl-D-alanine ligase [Prevotellaceae bacterium]
MDVRELYRLFRSHPVVTTDSRHCPQGGMFFALRGASFDGNAFAVSALEQGCAAAVVDDAKVAATDSRLILVDDALATLQALAHYHRSQLRGKTVIQITGTNGKTTTKELVAAVLATESPVQWTQGNLNNHIGVPLTLLTLRDDGGFAIIETGANHPGEIAQLSRIVDPDMGLITNVGRAHLGGFGSLEGVMRAKGELYDYIREHAENETAKRKRGIFLNVSAEHLPKMAEGINAVRYGLTGAAGAEVWGEVMECEPFVKFRYRRADTSWQEVRTHLIGGYNIHNLMAAVAVGLHYGVPPRRINEALAAYEPTNSRSEYHDTGRNRIIVDAYNANPSSMAVALDNFDRLGAPHKMLILGDMLELGEESEAEHRRIVERVRDYETVWLVGGEYRKVALPGMRCFASVEEVKEVIGGISGRTILIKGSNATKLFLLPTLL